MCDNCGEDDCNGKKSIQLAVAAGIPIDRWQSYDIMAGIESIIEVFGYSMKAFVGEMVAKELVIDANALSIRFEYSDVNDAMVMSVTAPVTNVDPNAPDDISELDNTGTL